MSSTKNLLLAALLLAPLAASAEEAKGPKVTFSGMVDAYYELNLSHGQTVASRSQFYGAEPGFNLNFAKLTTVAELAPVTVRLDLGFGPIISAIGNDHVEQAFASMKLGAFTVDAGRFVTPGGFEVYEAKDNWVYSKGLLFTYALPTAHEGVRVAFPLTEQLTLTGYVANGGDLSLPDNGASGSPYKTGILNLLFAKDATTAAGTLYVTKNPVTTQDGYLLDVVFTQGLGKISFNVSGDYGSFSSGGGNGSFSWLGLGASAKLQLSDPLKLVGRIEYLDDPDGGRTATGAAGVNLLSFTAGAGYAIGQNAELKAELRIDKASEDIYQSAKDSMVTAHLAAVAWF